MTTYEQNRDRLDFERQLATGTQPKTCRKCGLTLHQFKFGRNTQNADGLKSYCKVCEVAQCAAWRKANGAKWRSAQRKYRASHRAQRAAYQKRWRAKQKQKGAAE